MGVDRPRPEFTVGPSVAAYFRRNFRHHKGPRISTPFCFDGWQQEDIDLIYEVDADGRRLWTTVLWGMARGLGKSPITSGIGLLELDTRRDNPEVVCLSGSEAQAGHVLEPAKSFVHNGALSRRMRPYRREILTRGRPGKMQVVAADGALQHGGSASVGIIDEWHAFSTHKQEEAYNAIATSLHKRRGIELGITTAGFNLDSQLGERYRQMLGAPDVWRSEDGCLVIARDPATRMLMIWRGAPDGAAADDEAVWRACNPASWLEIDEIGIQHSKLPEHVFRRLHLNQWTEAEVAWLPPGAWSECVQLGAQIPDGAPVYLGVDVGLKYDSSAVVAVWVRDDGKLVPRAKVLQPRGDGTALDLVLVENEVREAARRWQVVEVAYDKMMFERSAQTLSDEGLLLVEFPQRNELMAPASARLFEAITTKRIEHDGDPTLSAHVAAGAVRETERGWRITKGKATRKIDALIALVMACARAEQSMTSGGFEW